MAAGAPQVRAGRPARADRPERAEALERPELQALRVMAEPRAAEAKRVRAAAQPAQAVPEVKPEPAEPAALQGMQARADSPGLAVTQDFVRASSATMGTHAPTTRATPKWVVSPPR